MTKLTKFIGMFAACILAACGGGSGGSSNIFSTPSPALKGIAAIGAPLVSAQMILKCANGATKYSTTNSSGQYEFNDLSGCSAPYVVTATAIVNGTTETLVSVYPTDISGSQNLNVTPITNAISATLSSNGDPLNLSSNISSESGNITSTSVSVRLSAIANALKGMIASASLDSTFDLLTGVFSANNQGFDRILDNLVVDIKSSGVSITNTGGVVHDDLGNLAAPPATDFSAGTIEINRNTDFASGLAQLPSQLLDSTFADSFQSVFNNCFASSSVNRGVINSLGATCQTLQIASDYLNDGRNAADEFNGRLQSSLYTGAYFSRPTIVRYLNSSPTDTRALVEFALMRADNVPDVITTVVERSAATGGVVKLRGNQRPFLIDVSGIVQKRKQVVRRNATTAKDSTFYMTGLQFYLDYNIGGAGNSGPNGVKYMHVTGPLLPTVGTGGIWLRKGPAGCDGYFTIWRDPSGNGAAPSGNAVNCAAIYQLSSRAATASDSDNYGGLFGTDLVNNPHFADVKVQDSEIKNIQPGTAYKFEVFLNSNPGTSVPDYIFYQRLKSRPYTMGDVSLQNGEIDQVRWSDGLQQSSIDALVPPAVTSGLPSTINLVNVSYIRTKFAPPPFKTWVQIKQLSGTQVDSMMLPVAPDYTDGDVISRNLSNNGGWNNPKLTAGPLTWNMIQLLSRNRYGTLIITDWRY